ncbi:hypothetical protein CP991_29775, partial [Escherichia coli]
MKITIIRPYVEGSFKMYRTGQHSAILSWQCQTMVCRHGYSTMKITIIRPYVEGSFKMYRTGQHSAILS